MIEQELQLKLDRLENIAILMKMIEHDLEERYENINEAFKKEQELREKVTTTLELCQTAVDKAVSKWNRHDALCETLALNDLHIETNMREKVEQSTHEGEDGEALVDVPAIYFKFITTMPNDEMEALRALIYQYATLMEGIFTVRAEIKPYLAKKEELTRLREKYKSLCEEIRKAQTAEQ